MPHIPGPSRNFTLQIAKKLKEIQNNADTKTDYFAQRYQKTPHNQNSNADQHKRCNKGQYDQIKNN